VPDDLSVHELLATPTVTLLDVECGGTCRERSPEDQVEDTQLVFPYRGVYVRHLRRPLDGGGFADEEDSVAEANQVLFFNAGEAFRISHPVVGGDASLVVLLEDSVLRELAPKELVRDEPGRPLTFRPHRLRIDPRAQSLVALLRHSLWEGVAETLEAESLALTLAQRAMGPRTSHASDASFAQQRLVDRVKIVLASDLARRWTLGEIAAEVRGSPVYLTQVFREVEGVPLYRYQLRLRLARALDLLPRTEDLSALSHDLGFSSHSHFSAAFRQAYGRSPTEFRQSAIDP
jgi:AraC family transcriptional regulator